MVSDVVFSDPRCWFRIALLQEWGQFLMMCCMLGRQVCSLGDVVGTVDECRTLVSFDITARTGLAVSFLAWGGNQLLLDDVAHPWTTEQRFACDVFEVVDIVVWLDYQQSGCFVNLNPKVLGNRWVVSPFAKMGTIAVWRILFTAFVEKLSWRLFDFLAATALWPRKLLQRRDSGCYFQLCCF